MKADIANETPLSYWSLTVIPMKFLAGKGRRESGRCRAHVEYPQNMCTACG